MSARGVSSPVGVILLLGITITAVTTLFIVGGGAITDSRTDAEQSQTENAMAQFSSKASLVGLGDSGDQRFSLGRISEGDVTVEPDAGRVTLYVNETEAGEREELNSTSLGAVVYRSGDREIAYQGGGVWERRGGWSRMVSPPEYHYRLETLTFPIVTVSGEGHSNGDVRGTVRTGAEPEPWFPVAGDDLRTNPLEEGTVIVQIESRYCEGWETFFRQRSQGILEQSCAEGEDDTVEVDLTIPFQIGSDRPVRSRTINPGTGNSDVPEDWEEDVVAPSISPEVERRIEQCQDGSCASLPEGDNITIEALENEDDLYWSDDDHTFEEVTFNTTDGGITAVINGSLNLDGDIHIEGDESVTLYVRGNVDTSPREFNTDGSADQLSIQVHTDADSVDISGSVQYTGVIYAPGSTINVNGATEIRGVIVGETVDISGNSPEFQQAEELDDYRIPGIERSLTYLHVSENPVEVELE